MSYRNQSCTSQELLSMLRRGNYEQFLTSLNQLPPENTDWFRIQMLSIRVLVMQKRMHTAQERIHTLSIRLTNPNERRIAHAEHLFYSWLFNGRQSSTLKELEAVLDLNETTDNVHHLLKNLALRTAAMKIQLGLMCSGEKSSVIDNYQRQIKTLNQEELEDEAFFCLLELVDFMVAKPSPDIPKAIATLDTHLGLRAYQDNSYRRMILRLTVIRFNAESSLRSEEFQLSNQPFLTAISELEGMGNKREVGLQLALYGHMLLEYGEVYGKKIINKSIRCHQEIQDDESVLTAVTSLISWLKLTGNQQSISGYLELISKPIVRKAIPDANNNCPANAKDVVMTANLILSFANSELQGGSPAKAREQLLGLRQSLEPLRNTNLYIKTMAQLDLCSLKLGNEVPQSRTLQLVELWTELGYTAEGLEYISQRVRRGMENETFSVPEDELNVYLEYASSIVQRGQMKVQLAESLGEINEVVALAFLYKNNPVTSLRLFSDANRVYTEFGLRPKKAFNHLCQAKVIELLLMQGGKPSLLNQAITYFDEAASLFRSMGCREATREAQIQKDRLMHKEHVSAMPDMQFANSNFDSSRSKKQYPLTESDLSQTPLYRRISAFVSTYERSTLISSNTQPFNQN